MKKIIVLLSFLTTALLAPDRIFAQGTDAVGGLFFAPLIYRLSLKPGETVKLPFDIVSPSSQSVQGDFKIFACTFADWSYGVQEVPSHPNDASAWFKEKSKLVTYTPGQKVKQVFEFTVPKNANGVYWAMMRFTPKPVGSTTTITIQYEIPLIFAVGRVGRPNLQSGTPEIIPQGKTVGVAVPFVNSGDGFSTIGVTGQLVPLGGGANKKFELSDRNLFPHSKRFLAFNVGTLADGRYRAIFYPEASGRRLGTVQRTFDVRNGKVVVQDKSILTAEAALIATPSGIGQELPRGGTKTLAVRVLNDGTKDVTANVVVGSVIQDESGSLIVDAKTPPKGVSIVLEPNEVTIPAKGVVSLRVTLKAAEDLTGDAWFAIQFIQKTNDPQLPPTIFGSVSAKGTGTSKLEWLNSKVEMANGSPSAISVDLSNSGTKALIPDLTGRVVQGGILTAATIQIEALGNGGVLPSSKVHYRVSIPPTLAPGEYDVEISARFGNGPNDVVVTKQKIKVVAPVAPKKTDPKSPIKPPDTKSGKGGKR